jgi:hypothetical protein
MLVDFVAATISAVLRNGIFTACFFASSAGSITWHSCLFLLDDGVTADKTAAFSIGSAMSKDLHK